MNNFVTIIFDKKESVDPYDILESVNNYSPILTENELEAYMYELDENVCIEVAINEITENTAEDIAMKIFDLGFENFDLEITEAVLTERTLRKGDRGEDVKVLQQQLLDLGFDPNGVDGIFGPGTERALRAFQQSAGITVDGLAGGQTQAAISAEAAPRNAGKERKGGTWQNQAGTPGNPKEVSRLRVGRLRDYVFDYTPENWRRLRRTHEAVTISDFGNRNNPVILMPRLPMNGQPPTNPDGPLYTNQGIRLDTPAQQSDEPDFIRTARGAIDSSDDTSPNSRPFWPTNYDGNDLIAIEGEPARAIAAKIREAYDNANYLEMWRLIHHYRRFYAAFTAMPDTYNGIRTAAERQLGSMTADQKREYGVTPLATTLNDLLPPQGESTTKIDDVVNEETYDGDEFHEAYGELWYNEDEEVDEAEYQGRKVKLGKPMRGDVKKFKVYVKNPKGNVVKVNFGDPNMKIKKSNPARRRSFRARHNCDNPGPRHKARYWSCRKW
jgi:peptidoglycan hydrolase-like protein with peptidoglycan-binding domain